MKYIYNKFFEQKDVTHKYQIWYKFWVYNLMNFILFICLVMLVVKVYTCISAFHEILTEKSDWERIIKHMKSLKFL